MNMLNKRWNGAVSKLSLGFKQVMKQLSTTFPHYVDICISLALKWGILWILFFIPRCSVNGKNYLLNMVWRKNRHFSRFFRDFLGAFYLTETLISFTIVMIFSNTNCFWQEKCLYQPYVNYIWKGGKGGVPIWKWHISRRKGIGKRFMDFAREWALQPAGRF